MSPVSTVVAMKQPGKYLMCKPGPNPAAIGHCTALRVVGRQVYEVSPGLDGTPICKPFDYHTLDEHKFLVLQPLGDTTHPVVTDFPLQWWLAGSSGEEDSSDADSSEEEDSSDVDSSEEEDEVDVDFTGYPQPLQQHLSEELKGVEAALNKRGRSAMFGRSGP